MAGAYVPDARSLNIMPEKYSGGRTSEYFDSVAGKHVSKYP